MSRKPRASGVDGRRGRRRPVAELGLDALGGDEEAAGPRRCTSVRASDAREPTKTVFVRGSVPQRVDGLARGDSEPAPLARREPPEAFVPGDLPPVLVEHGPVAACEPVAREEVPVVVSGEEARLLALRPGGRREARGARLGARLVLPLLAEREPEPWQMARVEAREHVGLVLGRIRAAGEQEPAAVLGDSARSGR